MLAVGVRRLAFVRPMLDTARMTTTIQLTEPLFLAVEARARRLGRKPDEVVEELLAPEFLSAQTPAPLAKSLFDMIGCALPYQDRARTTAAWMAELREGERD